VRFEGSRQRGAPSLHRRQCLVAGARLQRDVGGATEQLLLARLARRVEHHFIGCAGGAFAQFDLADQQLVEQRRGEAGIDNRYPLALTARARREEQAGTRQGQCWRHPRTDRTGQHRLAPETAIHSSGAP
jgi:hypothetical protein